MTGLYPGRTVSFVMEDKSIRAAVITEVIDQLEGLANLEVWYRPNEQQCTQVLDPHSNLPMLVYVKTSTRMNVRYDGLKRKNTFHFM